MANCESPFRRFVLGGLGAGALAVISLAVIGVVWSQMHTYSGGKLAGMAEWAILSSGLIGLAFGVPAARRRWPAEYPAGLLGAVAVAFACFIVMRLPMWLMEATGYLDRLDEWETAYAAILIPLAAAALVGATVGLLDTPVGQPHQPVRR